MQEEKASNQPGLRDIKLGPGCNNMGQGAYISGTVGGKVKDHLLRGWRISGDKGKGGKW